MEEYKMKTIVIINEQHSLLPQQSEIIRKKLGEEIELRKIPAEGINRQEIEELAKELSLLHNVNIVVLSPIPLLLGRLAHYSGECDTLALYGGSSGNPVYILHNDKREKKELPNGKVISTVAQEGWELIGI